MLDHPLPAPVVRRSVATLVAIVLGVWGLMAGGPAVAHDRLVGSEPADGATVEQAPGSVVLTFSADQLAVGAAVVVHDASGTDRADGAPTVAGPTVTQSLQPGLAAGTYTVQWRSVSGDGHPVEGSFVFEVTVGAGSAQGAVDTTEEATGAPGAEEDALAGDGAAGEAEEARAGVEDVPAARAAGAPETGADQRPGWGGPALLVAAIAAVAAAIVLVLRRSRSARAGEAA